MRTASPRCPSIRVSPTMVVDMACPKCGKQTTEYDENKWSCLWCGNKFIYAPIQPNHTFVQSNVHIQGQATFELDAQNAKPASPKMVKMSEHDPDCFGKQIKDVAQKVTAYQRLALSKEGKKYFALIIFGLMAVFGCFVVLPLVFSPKLVPDDRVAIAVALVFWGLLSLIPLFIFLKSNKELRKYNSMVREFQQTRSSLEQQNLMDIKIGDYVICPHCESVVSYVPLNSPSPVEGLKHCLKCGKQFFISGLNSFPILLTK